MSLTNPTKRPRRIVQPAGYGPQIGFAGAIFACVAAWGAAAGTLPAGLVMPLVASLLLLFATTFAAVAWRKGPTDAEDVTYWDVAGGLMLIGLFAAATVDPNQLVGAVMSEGER